MAWKEPTNRGLRKARMPLIACVVVVVVVIFPLWRCSLYCFASDPTNRKHCISTFTVGFCFHLGLAQDARVTLPPGSDAIDSGCYFYLAGVNDFESDPDYAEALDGRDESIATVLLAHQPKQVCSITFCACVRITLLTGDVYSDGIHHVPCVREGRLED